MTGNELATVENSQQMAMIIPEQQKELIKSMFAKNATDDELGLLMYYSERYGLDILTKELWFVKFNNQPAQIYAGRDGMLKIAHASGQFDGMESGLICNKDGVPVMTEVKDKGGKETRSVPLGAWAKVYRRDMSHPVEITVYFEEYDQKQSLWLTKPRTMITKVAESQALRKAFTISGVYSPEEMPTPEMKEIPDTSKPSTPGAKAEEPVSAGAMICDECGTELFNTDRDINARKESLTHFNKILCPECFGKRWAEKKKADGIE
jgi:phage recombination protein Bet